MSDVADRVKKIVVEHLGVEEGKVTDNASFIDDLGADSLDTVELVMAFEEEFGVEIPDDAAEKISTVKDAIEFIQHDVTEQRTQRASLRHAHVRARSHAIRHDYFRFEPASDEREHASIRDSLCEPRHQTLVPDPIEETLQIQVDHPLIPFVHVLGRFGDCRVAATSRSKTVTR